MFAVVQPKSGNVLSPVREKKLELTVEYMSLMFILDLDREDLTAAGVESMFLVKLSLCLSLHL